jgi:hypothetical protein
MPVELDARERDEYLRHNEANARGLAAEEFDVVVVHDPRRGTTPRAGRRRGRRNPGAPRGRVCGCLASTPADVAARVVALLEDPVTARPLGAAGHDRVRERFLLPRLLRGQLRLLVSLIGA